MVRVRKATEVKKEKKKRDKDRAGMELRGNRDKKKR